MPDTFSITVTGSRPDDDGRDEINEEPFQIGPAYLIQALVDDGWPRDQITWEVSYVDGQSGSGDGTDFAEVTLPGGGS